MPSEILNALSNLYSSPAYNQKARIGLQGDENTLRYNQMITDQLAQQQADQAGLRFQLGTSQAPLGGVPTEGVPAGGGLSATMPNAPPDPDKVALDYWASKDPAMHASIMQNIGKQATEIEQRSGPQEATAFFNKKTGMNLQVNKAGKIISVNDKGVLISGIQNQQTGAITETGRLGEAEPLSVKEGEKLVDRKTLKTIVEGAPKETDKSKDEQLAFDAYAAGHPELKKTGSQLDPNQRVAAIGAFKQKTGSTDAETQAAHLRVLKLTEQEKTLDLSEKRKQASDTAVNDIAADIVAGRIAPQQMAQLLGRGGKDRVRIMAAVHQLNPTFNFAEGAQNYQAGITNQKQIRSLDAADQSLSILAKASKEFGRTEIGVVNDIVLAGKVQINNPKAIQFQTALTGTIDDVASALSGGGTVTDAGRAQATRIFKTSYSQGGLDAALNTVHDLLKTRRSAFARGTTYEHKEVLPSGGSTNMQAPDGSQYAVPNNLVEKYKQKGATVVQ
jgi:hypothetical protein